MEKKIRELWKADPFRPFTMHLADGRELPVSTRSSVHVAPQGGLVLYCDFGDDLKLLNPSLITEIAMTEQRVARKR